MHFPHWFATDATRNSLWYIYRRIKYHWSMNSKYRIRGIYFEWQLFTAITAPLVRYVKSVPRWRSTVISHDSASIFTQAASRVARTRIHATHVSSEFARRRNEWLTPTVKSKDIFPHGNRVQRAKRACDRSLSPTFTRNLNGLTPWEADVDRIFTQNHSRMIFSVLKKKRIFRHCIYYLFYIVIILLVP